MKNNFLGIDRSILHNIDGGKCKNKDYHVPTLVPHFYSAFVRESHDRRNPGTYLT